MKGLLENKEWETMKKDVARIDVEIISKSCNAPDLFITPK